MKMDRKRSRFQGTILGGAVAEARGNPVEGWTREEIAAEYGVLNRFVEMYDDPGTVTDDMELEAVTGQSLIDAGGFDLHGIADGIKRWSINPTSPGKACQTAAVNLNTGTSPHYSGIDSAGNGAAMRVASLGLVYSHPEDIELLRDCVTRSSRITHNNPEAVAGALAVAYGIAHNVNDSRQYNVDDFLREVSGFVRGESKEMAERVSSIKFLLKEGDDKAIQELGNGGYVMESVPFAIYCFAKSPGNYEESILRAVNAGGDTDTNAKMTGNLSGSLNGMEVIPEKWIDELKPTNWFRERMLADGTAYNMRDYLIYLSDGLFRMYNFSLPKDVV